MLDTEFLLQLKPLGHEEQFCQGCGEELVFMEGNLSKPTYDLLRNLKGARLKSHSQVVRPQALCCTRPPQFLIQSSTGKLGSHVAYGNILQ